MADAAERKSWDVLLRFAWWRTGEKMDPSQEIRQLRERIDCVPDWIWEVDLSGKIAYSNRVVRDLLGYSPRKVVGTNIFDMVVEQDAEKCRDLFGRAVATGEPVRNVITRFRTKNSSLRTVEVSCSPITDDEQKLTGFRGITRDITEQFERRQIAEKVVQNSQTGMFVVQDSLLVYVNTRICELMGYAPEEVLGTRILDYIYPEDAVWLAHYEHRRIAGEDIPTHYTARGVTKSGEIRHFDFRSSVIQHKGAPAVLLNAVDITEAVRAREALGKSERDYRDLVEKTSDWVWQVDENFVYTYASPRSRDMFGYEPEEIVGKSPLDLMPPDEAKRVGEIFAPITARRESFAMIENTMVPHDGHLIVVETSGEPIFDEQGEFRGYRGIDRDITQRKKTEEQLRKATSEMETVFHAFPDIYFWLDADGRIIDYHAADPTELYTPPEEFMGKMMNEVLPGDVGQRFAEAISRVVQTGSMASTEYLLELPQGERYYEARLMPLPDNQVLAIVRNITERRRADKDLGESQEMLRLVLTNIPQFVFWKDINSVYMGCNENFARVAGVGSPEGIVGKTDYDLTWGSAEADSYREWDRRVMASDKPEYHIAETQLTPGGTIIVDTNKVPLHDAEGRVVGILGTYEDITERKQAEQALQEAEAKYRSLVEETMVGVYMIQDDKFVYANPRMLEIFGATSEQMLGKSPLEFVVPENRALVVENLRKRARGEVKSARYGFRALRMDGVPIDVEVHGSVTSFKGRPAVIGSLVDITERKHYLESLQENEERYRQLFEHSPDMVMLISAATSTFIAMNPAVTQVLGYAPHEVLGKSPWDISPEFQPTGKRSKDEVMRLMAGQVGAPAHRFEWVHQRKDGALVNCEISLVSYRFHGEELIQAIVRDVTERKRAEENRRRLEKDLDTQKRSFYRETILSVTDGKLDICDYADVEPYIVGADSCVEVENASQVGPARHKAESLIHEHGLTGDRLDAYIIGVGEAITNAIKHGVHGTVGIGEDDKYVWVVVSDKGTGIESLILPRAVLLKGFSTKPSLGLGYSIMLDVCDQILLSTGDRGTTVVLIKDKVEHDLSMSPDLFPDTWDNIPS